MKRFYLLIVLLLSLVVLASCKAKFDKYHTEITNKLPLQVTENIKFPLVTDDGKYTIKWSSEDTKVINNFGVFTKPMNSKQIKLTYTLYENEKEVYTSYFNVVAVGIMPE